MARAVSTLGIDRGISAFHRYTIVKGRVGGDNYNTAASLGRFDVRELSDANLLRQVDPWLDRFRRAGGSKNAPPRFGVALRTIDGAVFDFCKHGTVPLFQKIIIALGLAERELASADKFRDAEKLRPLVGLSLDWIIAADDRSVEFSIALALASLHDPQQAIGPLRVNLEAVDWKTNCRAWAEKDRSVVWNSANLSTNLANVLQRRLMDGQRAGCHQLPLASPFHLSLEAVAAFLAGEIDEERAENLLWGLMLINPRKKGDRMVKHFAQIADASTLPRDYALLKLLFLPQPLVPERLGDHVRWRLARTNDNDQADRLAIRSEPRIIPLLRAGRVGEACRIAAQRLRISGLPPMPGPQPSGAKRDSTWEDRQIEHGHGQRLAAALLFPVSSISVNRLVNLVCRDQSVVAETIAVSAEGASA